MNTNRTAVFISYSHKDSKWLDSLSVHLKPLERNGLLDRWDDTRIKAGNKWRKEIEDAINRAKIAILIVSPDFLASDFIMDNELPSLLKLAEMDGLMVLPLIVRPCAFTRTPSISQYQAANDPNNALSKLQEHEQDQILDDLSSRIEEIIKVSQDATSSNEDDKYFNFDLAIHNLKFGSFVELINNSSRSINIEKLVIEDEKIDYLEMRWNEVNVPKISRLSPNQSCMLLFGINNKVVFNGVHLAKFDEWKRFTIYFYDDRSSYILIGDIISPNDGNIMIRNLKTRMTGS